MGITMNDNQLICDPARIERFLGDSLSEAEQSAFESHLDDCVDCRRRLEAAAAGEEVWSGVRESLMSGFAEDGGDVELDLTSDGAAPYCHAAILALLAPSDDERSLGRLGTYEVVGVVGSGGMGVVLKAFDSALDRYVAIKLMAPHLGGSGAARRRFAREAKAAAAVVHDNVIEIHGVSDADGLPYLVMPYVRGPSLQRRLDDQGPLAIEEILRIGMQAAAGLAAAHAQGLIHRDVSPGNILLEDGVERVKLTDFGLARAADDASLTRSGMIAGTPQYMSPEQARGEGLDQRSDLFSLGSVFFAMCTGRPPFRAETSYGVLRRITDEEPRPIREINPDIPEWLCRIVARLMAKDPGERFPSAREVAELLERCLAHVQQPMAAELPVECRETASVKVGGRGRRLSGRLLAGAAFVFAVLLAGVVIVLELNKGTLTIESDADDVPIRVMQGDEVAETLTVTRRGAAVRIAAGQYVVEIAGRADGIAIENGMVRLERGGREIVKIVKSSGLPAPADAAGHATARDVFSQFLAEVDARHGQETPEAAAQGWRAQWLSRLLAELEESDDPDRRRSIATAALGLANALNELTTSESMLEILIDLSRSEREADRWRRELAGIPERKKLLAQQAPRRPVQMETLPDGSVVLRGSAEDVHQAAEQIRAAEVGGVRVNAPATDAEKAVARLVLVFFQDRSRRAVPAVLVDAGMHTLAVTAGPATIVPDRTPAAIDRAFLEVRGRGTVNATFIEDSSLQLAVYRAARGLTDYRLTDTVELAPGDVLSAIFPDATPELYVTPKAARVVAVDREAELNLPERGIEASYEGLVEIDRLLPEGTPVFKDGKLAGLTLLGTRFAGGKGDNSYVMPINHIRGLLERKRLIENPALSRLLGQAAGREAPSPAPDENTPGRTRLRVLDAGGKPVADNRVILGRQGYAGANLPGLSATPSHRGVISLDNLFAGTHWLMLRGDPPAAFKLVLPAGEGMIVRSPQQRSGLIGKNLEVKMSVGMSGESEILVLEIHNRTKEAVSLSEKNLDLLTAIEGPEADAHVLSPRWSEDAAARETRIEPGQTVKLGLNWNDWVRNGFWFSRDGEVIAEPVFPEAAAGKTWVRIAQFSAMPVEVTHPDKLIAGEIGHAAADRVRRFAIDAAGNQTTIAYSPDGYRVAVAAGNPTRILQTAGTSRVKGEWRPVVEILDAASGESVATLRLTSDEENGVIAATERITHVEATALAFSRDGKVLGVGTNIGQVKLFDAATGKLVRALDHQEPRLAAEEAPENWRPIPRAIGSVADLAFSPDGELLAVCGETFAEFADVFDGVERLSRSGAGPGRLKVWNIATGKLEHDLPGHSYVEAIAFSPDRGLLASAGRWDSGGESGSGAILWNPYAGTIIQKVSIPANGGARAVAISPDSKLAAIASQNFDNANDTSSMTITLAHPLSGVVGWQRTIPGWARPVVFTPDGKSVVALCGGKSIQSFDVATGEEQREIRAAEGERWTDLAIAPEGDTLAVGAVDNERRCFVNVLSLGEATNAGADALGLREPTAPAAESHEFRQLQELEADDDASAATDPAEESDAANAPPAPAATTLRFSEPKEIVLSMGSVHFMLDLDTGQTMDPPARPRPAQQRVMDVRSTQVQPYQYPTGLTGLLLKGVKVKPSDWDASVTDVQEKLGSDAAEPLTEMQYDPAESSTWFFRTDEGATGVLQIIGLAPEPKGIRIRYKTIVASPTAPPGDGE
jgi:WD40 repeat protein